MVLFELLLPPLREELPLERDLLPPPEVEDFCPPLVEDCGEDAFGAVFTAGGGAGGGTATGAECGAGVMAGGGGGAGAVSGAGGGAAGGMVTGATLGVARTVPLVTGASTSTSARRFIGRTGTGEAPGAGVGVAIAGAVAAAGAVTTGVTVVAAGGGGTGVTRVPLMGDSLPWRSCSSVQRLKRLPRTVSMGPAPTTTVPGTTPGPARPTGGGRGATYPGGGR